MLARNPDHRAATERTFLRRSARGLSRLRWIMACAGILMGCADFSSTAQLTLTETPLPTLRGAIEEFVIPTARSDSYGITTGPDGNLWFTESKPFKIGRITLQGTITEFPIATSPLSNAFVTGITAGPDSDLWFTLVNDASTIGRVTPQGLFTEFPLPSPDADPVGIVAGPDKALFGSRKEWPTRLGVSLPAALSQSSPSRRPRASPGLSPVARIRLSGSRSG
jgi:hypothetical protein